MRVIHGEFSGRRLHLPKSIKARPTTDFAREGLFNILRNRVDFTEISVLDLFAGTGAIGYEFASLGTKDIVSVEINYRHVTAIQNNCEILGITTLRAIKADAIKYIESNKRKFDLIFADPPYDIPILASIPDLIREAEILSHDGLLIMEHGPSTKFHETQGYQQTRKYGKVHFSFFEF